MATQKTEWGNLSEIQLKGALVRRGLDTAGTKEELIKRLQDHEEGKPGETVETDNSEDDGSSILTKNRMSYGYYLSLSLKSVIIRPFKLSLLADEELVTLLDEALSYNIKKTKVGDSAMIVKFPSAVKGDTAYVEIKKKLADMEDIKVYHPLKDSLGTYRAGSEDSFASLVNDTPIGALVDRCVLLENLPESLNTEEKLSELFPEAADVVSYQHEPWSKGMAILDFLSQKEASEFLKNSGEEIELEGEKIGMTKFVRKAYLFQRISSLRLKKNPKKEVAPLSDQDRINKTGELKAMQDELVALQNSEEEVGQDKVNKLIELEEKFREESREYMADTNRRVRAKQMEMPEGEDNMLDHTKHAISRAKETSNGEKRGTGSADRGKKPDLKRSASGTSVTTPRGRGRGRLSLRGRTSQTAGRSTVSKGSRRGTVSSFGRGGGLKRSGGRGDYGQPPNKRYSTEGDRGGRDDSGTSVKLIEGLTSVLTDKMRTLEQLQQQTLKTQAQLMKGGEGMSDRRHYDGGSASYGNMSASSSFRSPSGASYGGGYDDTSSYGNRSSNMDSSYGLNSGGSYGVSSSGGNYGRSSGSYYAPAPSGKRRGSSRGGYKKGSGRYRKK